MPNCLVGCVPEHLCQAPSNAVEGHNIAPVVKVFFETPDDPAITVGNKSAPFSGNHAVVKSMEYSMGSDGKGHQVKVEIADEQGGNFFEFAERINKCIEKASSEHKMKVRFGWVIANCDGSVQYRESPTLCFIPDTLSVDFSSGVTKFVIEGHDLVTISFGAHLDQIMGSDDQKLPLKQAIRRIANETEPKFNVRFARIEPDGTLSEWDFREFPGDGPESKWQGDSQHKLGAIMKWIEPYRTDRNKGITPIWLNTSCDPTLILLEDPKPACNESAGCSRVIASYVVNGGACSPVIKFTPTLNWNLAAAAAMASASGNSGSSEHGESVKKDKSECDVQTRETGMQQSIAVTEQARDTFGPREARPKMEDSQNAHAKANRSQLTSALPVKAELQIQGDPDIRFVDVTAWTGKTVSLAVINPFHLDGNGNGGCGDWIARPGCNNVLSNKQWMIMGVNHTIKEGSYTTTLSLRADSPEVDIAGGLPLGGPGSGGWTPPNTC